MTVEGQSQQQQVPMQQYPTGQPAAAPGAAPTAVYAFPMGSNSNVPPLAPPSQAGASAGGPIRTSESTAVVPAGGASAALSEQPRDIPPRSPSTRAAHNAFEQRRRRKIANHLDRLRAMLNAPKQDTAALLAEVATRLQTLTERCRTLEREIQQHNGAPAATGTPAAAAGTWDIAPALAAPAAAPAPPVASS